LIGKDLDQINRLGHVFIDKAGRLFQAMFYTVIHSDGMTVEILMRHDHFEKPLPASRDHAEADVEG
jgi:hypothetical protein